jgi:hypothetical protein
MKMKMEEIEEEDKKGRARLSTPFSPLSSLRLHQLA